ncbi:MFS transporter [Sodalis sp. dw_96]|uniref:MFS transporter n=1 Tax=Sodalis sp. dw_96 TaxID=2719794 RepID=UPI001BD637BF|nr:MFS transporter [Sodalis sp. dw_96]
MNNDPKKISLLTFLPIIISLSLAGLAELASLYSVQAMLPKLSEVYGIPLNQVGLLLSVEIGCLALALLFSGSLSDRFGRKRVIVCSLLAGSLLTLSCSLASTWPVLLMLCGLLGLTVSGITAAVTVYISEEILPAMAGIITGYFIFGNSLGSMSGRVIASQLMDHIPVGAIFIIFGVILLMMALLVLFFLPSSKNFVPTPSLNLALLLHGGIAHFRNKTISMMFIVGFMIFGSFTSVFNFIAFYLHNAPFHLSYAWIGLIPVSFSLTFFSGPAAGRATLKHGAMNVLTLLLSLMLAGIVITLLTENIVVFIGGVILFAVSFFTSHSVALAWVSKNAQFNKGQATSFYLFFYYLGGAAIGYLNGFIFARFSWDGMIIAIVTMLSIALLTCRILQRRLLTQGAVSIPHASTADAPGKPETLRLPPHSNRQANPPVIK